MEKTFNYYHLDAHTTVVSVDLTQEEKKQFGIDENHFAVYNEIGFATPQNSNAWAQDCFNILVSRDASFDNVDVLLLDIEQLPKRLGPTYHKILGERG